MMSERKYYNWPEFMAFIGQVNAIFGNRPSREDTRVSFSDDGVTSKVVVAHENGSYIIVGTPKALIDE